MGLGCQLIGLSGRPARTDVASLSRICSLHVAPDACRGPEAPGIAMNVSKDLDRSVDLLFFPNSSTVGVLKFV